MKVSISWLKELVDLNIPVEKLVNILPLKSISTKEVTDEFIELDMKGYNRTDLLSLRGVAREVSAITGSSLTFKKPQESEFVWIQDKLPTTPTEVLCEDLSPVQCVAKIENLSFGKSKEIWVKKLESSGMREVNNIADITNLIMLEYGEPLHAFDGQTVNDETIIVRRAKEGEEIITLDHKLRKLTQDDIVLADNTKLLDVAGIMGGENTEIKESTTSILLSASLFNPQMVRKTSQRLGLQSEASKRFYHGLTKKGLIEAFNAAIKMYQELGGKVTAVNIIGNVEDKKRKIKLTKAKLEDLVGVKFSEEQAEEYLKRTGAKLFHLEGGWEVEVPYWRLDLNIEEDLIEEVARLYGYDKIPSQKVSESEALQKEDPIFKTISNLREKLVSLGLTEVQTYSFYSTDVLNSLGFNSEYRKYLVRIANPISAETEYLRMNLWPNLVEALGKNLRKGFKDIAIFEIGKAFQPNKEGEPQEEYRLSIALSNSTDNPIEELVSLAKKLDFDLKQSKPEGIGATLTSSSDEGKLRLFHPKRFVAVEKSSKQIGEVSEVHLRVLDNLGISKRVAVLEISLS